ncbi:MAG: KpsF/GutQ family sugar-phosphate isomerase [Proteobacteria bacterium]|nr:KpsF/GutQ family sugar-phosphate isomerase [Cystobacterineae bacterium]MCL2258871.1 KpsF/GutQ family sugar-phosphate isomerase [Cystobacterineae bacterium]MCL2314477.1 KpsF/GutQ family sugar-phosphate isomerase [Pseudomonadota bacterium]
MPLPENSILHFAQTVLETEAAAILTLRDKLNGNFEKAVALMLQCRGHIVTMGMGKPGFIAQKLSATLASVGIPSFFLHPAEAAHGDIGRIAPGDVGVVLSNSGATEELLRLLPAFKRLEMPLIVLTGDAHSPLAQHATTLLEIGAIHEACPMGLVPTASSAALHAMADALALSLAREREMTPEKYALLHPAGALGRSVMRVGELMRQGPSNPVVRENAPLSEAILVMTQTPGKPGASNVVDAEDKLVGIFTDGDLRRLIQSQQLNLEAPIGRFMKQQPRCAYSNELAMVAATRMRQYQVDQLPVVDEQGKAIGLLDIQDLLAIRLI